MGGIHMHHSYIVYNSALFFFLGLRDIIFPIVWFSDGIDGLDDADTLSLLRTAVFLPDTARSIM